METTTREQLLANIRMLSDRITNETATVGITLDELERNARKALAIGEKRRADKGGG